MQIELSQKLVDELIEIDRERRAEDDEPATASLLDLTDVSARNPDDNPQLDLIYALPLEQIQQLTAIMWLARDEFESYADALRYAENASHDKGEATTYVAEKPLHEYLPIGIETIRREGIHLSP